MSLSSSASRGAGSSFVTESTNSGRTKALTTVEQPVIKPLYAVSQEELSKVVTRKDNFADMLLGLLTSVGNATFTSVAEQYLECIEATPLKIDATILPLAAIAACMTTKHNLHSLLALFPEVTPPASFRQGSNANMTRLSFLGHLICYMIRQTDGPAALSLLVTYKASIGGAANIKAFGVGGVVQGKDTRSLILRKYAACDMPTEAILARLRAALHAAIPDVFADEKGILGSKRKLAMPGALAPAAAPGPGDDDQDDDDDQDGLGKGAAARKDAAALLAIETALRSSSSSSSSTVTAPPRRLSVAAVQAKGPNFLSLKGMTALLAGELFSAGGSLDLFAEDQEAALRRFIVSMCADASVITASDDAGLTADLSKMPIGMAKTLIDSDMTMQCIIHQSPGMRALAAIVHALRDDWVAGIRTVGSQDKLSPAVLLYSPATLEGLEGEELRVVVTKALSSSA